MTHVPTTNQILRPLSRVGGVFDPVKVKAFDPLSQVPLGVYQPVAATPATRPAGQRPDGSDLLPNLNLGGFVSQPVNLITTLTALPALENTAYSGDVHATDPISVIRVRVAGVTGPDALSRSGSRGRPADRPAHAPGRGHRGRLLAGADDIDLPAEFGQPALTLTETG